MDADLTKDKILAAADSLFGELGFDATTTRDIAERSGVNKALIHYHFGTKDDLLEALLESYYARMTHTLQAALGKRSGLEAQVTDLLDAYADFLGEHHSFTRIVQREVASGRHMERIVARTLPMFQLGVDWMGSALKKPPKDFDAVNLLTSVYGLVVTWFTHGEVIRRLTGKDPFSPAALAARKRHVHKVVGLLLAELEERRG
ncbi:MAG: CerR family C-terminal domain-containing protein [Myxococcaceae bacterium]